MDVRTGWVPRHLVARDAASGAVLGVAPAYLKGHSYGEYGAKETAGGSPRLSLSLPSSSQSSTTAGRRRTREPAVGTTQNSKLLFRSRP